MQLAAATTLLESQLIKGNIHKEANPYKVRPHSAEPNTPACAHFVLFWWQGSSAEHVAPVLFAWVIIVISMSPGGMLVAWGTMTSCPIYLC